MLQTGGVRQFFRYVRSCCDPHDFEIGDQTCKTNEFRGSRKENWLMGKDSHFARARRIVWRTASPDLVCAGLIVLFIYLGSKKTLGTRLSRLPPLHHFVVVVFKCDGHLLSPDQFIPHKLR